MEQKQKYKLNKEKWIKKLENAGIDYQTIDFGSYAGDIKFSAYLQNEYGIALTDLKAQANYCKAQFEKTKSEEIQFAREQEIKLIDEWKSQKIEEVEIKEFNIAKHLILCTARGFNNATILTGEGGIGKSFLTIATILKETKDFEYKCGFVTPLSLYMWLYKHQDKLCIIDDTEGIFTDDKSISILKGSLWDINGKRIVQYDTTSDKAGGVPPQFEFSGRLIILCNKVPNENDISVSAMLSRTIHYKVEFSYAQKLKVMIDILNNKSDLTQEQKKKAINILKENTSLATNNFNIRTMEKLCSYIKYNEKLAKKLFEATNITDEEKELIMKMMEKGMIVSEQIKEFVNKTGKSRRQYFYIKKGLRCLK